MLRNHKAPQQFLRQTAPVYSFQKVQESIKKQMLDKYLYTHRDEHYAADKLRL